MILSSYKEKNIKSVALPPLGCGLGGLPWLDVKKRIEYLLAAELNDVQIIVYEPNGAPSIEKMSKTSVTPKNDSGESCVDRIAASIPWRLVRPICNFS